MSDQHRQLDREVYEEVLLKPLKGWPCDGAWPAFSSSVALCFAHVVQAMGKRGFSLSLDVLSGQVCVTFETCAGGFPTYRVRVKNEGPTAVPWAICQAALKAVRAKK